MGEWFALPLIEAVADATRAPIHGSTAMPRTPSTRSSIRSPNGSSPGATPACGSAARPRARTGWSDGARRLGKAVFTDLAEVP